MPGTIAVPRTGETSFHGISFNRNDLTVHEFDRAGFKDELEDESVFSWIDIEGPDIGALNEVLDAIDIDLELIGHFQEPEVLPRIVERSDCLAFYLYEIARPEKHLEARRGITELDFSRMILVLSRDYVITYHIQDMEIIDHVRETCAESFRFAGKSPAFIAFLLLQRCLYDYAHLNLANDNYLDVLEGTVLTGRHEDVAANISVASANILTLKRLASSLHIVLMLIATKRSPFIGDQARVSFGEMLQNVISVRDAIDSSRDLLDGIVGSLQAEAANRTSEIARTLTVLSALILPLTFIAGIYGMNFENMPELRSPYGYFIVLGVMAAVTVVMLLAFRRLGWLGNSARK